MSGQKVFWMRESLERDFFASDNDGYATFLKYTSVLASTAIGIGSLEAPINALGGLKDTSIVSSIKDKLTDYAKDKFKEKVEDGAKSLFEKALLAGHGEIAKGKVTDDDVKRGWIELGQKAVLFLLSLPVGGAPITGVLLLFSALKLLHTIDTAKKHVRYQEIIDSMMTKYTNIVVLAEKKRADRIIAERPTASFGVDFNDALDTKQEDRIVFQGTDRQKVYEVTQLQVDRTRSQLGDLKKAGGSVSPWNKNYDPDTMTKAELARIYLPFRKSFDDCEASGKRKDIISRVEDVMQQKSGIWDLNAFVPVQGTGTKVTDDEGDYSESMDERI